MRSRLDPSSVSSVIYKMAVCRISGGGVKEVIRSQNALRQSQQEGNEKGRMEEAASIQAGPRESTHTSLLSIKSIWLLQTF